MYRILVGFNRVNTGLFWDIFGRLSQEFHAAVDKELYIEIRQNVK